jgi:hypothetical protein
LAQDPDAQRYIAENNLALAGIQKMSRDARDQLMKGLAQGTGQAGNPNAPRGPGDGGNNGKGGTGTLSQSQKRVMRWTMLFDTQSGADYVRQLDALGAIIGVPMPNEQYKIIRNLKQKPAQGQVEDLTKINRIFWVDNNPESVQSLANGLGLKPTPELLVAFFPKNLEEKLAKLERDYKKLEEDQILETRFRVVKKGGVYEPVVLDQRPKEN